MSWRELASYARRMEKKIASLAHELTDLRIRGGQGCAYFYNWEAYAIQHNKTKRAYIGSANDIVWRIKEHLSALRGHRHPVELMQEDFDKYGEDYSFYVLNCNSWWGNPVEKKMQYMFRTADAEYGYNYKEKMYRYSFDGFRQITMDEIESAIHGEKDLYENELKEPYVYGFIEKGSLLDENSRHSRVHD